MKNIIILVLTLVTTLVCSQYSQANEEAYFENVKEEYFSLLEKPYALIPHRGTFFIPFSYNDNPNNIYNSIVTQTDIEDRGNFNRNLEAEIQISFAFSIARNIFKDHDLLLGYTHQSWWQLYNSDWSKPFRETNYMPELFFRNILNKPWNFLGGKIIGYDVGYVHQSNGQVQLLSRSWDRLQIRFMGLFGKTLLSFAAWYRIPEEDDLDDNPDIHNYYGYGEIKLAHLFGRSKLELKIIPGVRKQGGELSYSYPLQQGLRLYFKAGYGYGLSMIDYNHETRRTGLGIVLSDFLLAEANYSSKGQ